MAGHGEANYHTAALLFSIDDMMQVRNKKTTTQEKAYWPLLVKYIRLSVMHS